MGKKLYYIQLDKENLKGEITNNKYKYTGGFSNGVSVVIDENDKYGLIDINGKEIVQPQYYNIGGVANKFIGDSTLVLEKIIKDGEEPIVSCGIINRKGNIRLLGRVKISNFDEYFDNF